MNNKETRRSGVGVLGLLGIAFIILKLCKVIEWSWLWFVGKDVAEILGYTKLDAMYRVVENEDKLIIDPQSIENTGFPQNGAILEPNPNVRRMAIINESGLYDAIFSSKLPQAKSFKRWVTSEVLPSIRKHGAYMTPETIEEAILNPDTIIKIATALKEEQDKNRALEATNSALAVEKQIMQPKADYFDELVDRNLLTNFRETAKQLGIKQREFINFLLDKKYIYRDKRGKLMPYADKNKGLFEIKETLNEKTQWSGTQTLITPKGRETFRLLYIQAS